MPRRTSPPPEEGRLATSTEGKFRGGQPALLALFRVAYSNWAQTERCASEEKLGGRGAVALQDFVHLLSFGQIAFHRRCAARAPHRARRFRLGGSCTYAAKRANPAKSALADWSGERRTQRGAAGRQEIPTAKRNISCIVSGPGFLLGSSLTAGLAGY